MQEKKLLIIILKNFKSRLFPIKNLYKILSHERIPEVATEQTTEVLTEPTKAKKVTKAKFKCKMFSLELREEFLDKMKNEEKYINKQIFREYFNYQSH